jgi:hypothetical protein
MNLDPREVEFYLKTAKMPPRLELVYRLALAGLSPHCRNKKRTAELMAGFSEDEVRRVIAEAQEFECELAGDK